MGNLRKTLPSGNQLIVFEAAARHLSFSKTSQELGVSQSAVSRMIRRIEDHIGCSLFTRSPVGISLTRDGEMLFRATTQGFNDMKHVVDQIRQSKNSTKVVTLSVSSAFVSHWLIHNIEKFYSLHPDIDLQFQLIGGEPTGLLKGADLGVRLLPPEDSDSIEPQLAQEVVIPVCSPDYAARFGTLDNPTRVQKHTLIRFDEPRFSWKMYFEEAKINRLTATKEVTFTDYSVVLHAALAGQGIALGWHHVLQYAIQHGLLIYAGSHTYVSGDFYQLVCNKNCPNDKEVKQVSEWLINEFSVFKNVGVSRTAN
jgi:DNA-binding transcriptional LysR family regulator